MRLFKRCKCPEDKQATCDCPFYFRAKVRGQRRELSTGTPDRARASVEAGRRVIQERKRADAGVGAGRCRLSQLAAAHIVEARRERISKARLTVIGYHWKPVLEHFGPSFDPAAFGGPRAYELLAGFFDKRRETVAGQTIEREAWCLHQGLRIGRRRDEIEDFLDREDWPTIGHDPKNTARAGKLHPPAWVGAVLDACDLDLQERIEVDARTALRKHELMRMCFSWAREAPAGMACAGILCPPGEFTKDGDPRVIPIDDRVLGILRARFERPRPLRRKNRQGERAPVGDLVFIGDRKRALYAAMARARRAEVERLASVGMTEAHAWQLLEQRGWMRNLTFRDLRHAYANGGDDKRAAADLLGHAKLSTTDIYLHSTPERLATFASEAGSWFDALREGGATKGVQHNKGFGGVMQNQQLFRGERMVVATGIEPVTPTVSSEGPGPKPLFSFAHVEHAAHGKSRGYTEEGEQGRGCKETARVVRPARFAFAGSR